MKRSFAILGLGAVFVVAAGRLIAAQRVDDWSSPKTWSGGHLPAAGANVVIPEGKTVLLDTPIPPLGQLVVKGTLIFADRDLELRARSILVEGRLTVGTADHPFRHRATISLDTCGAATDPNASTCSGNHSRLPTEAAFVVTGKLDLYGLSGKRSWTRLGANVEAGATEIETDGPSGWQPGDRIALAPTDFDVNDAESATVKEVRGRTAVLASPLRHPHWGRVTRGVDERAEVGLLSHNIVVQGVGHGLEQGLGGHLMVRPNASVHLERTEFRAMGQRGRLGRYPIHFHLAGPMRDSWVRDCSVHDCFNRAITLHGTHGVRLERNVAYETVGHAFFLEDGIETGNVLTQNLGIAIRAPKKENALLPTDLQPAVFWITHPSNDLAGNVAAGSEGFGFWYSLPKAPTGPSGLMPEAKEVLPRKSRLGRFSGNVAHSCAETALFVDNPPNPPGVSEAPTYDPPRPAVFEGFVGYKARKRGAWLRGSRLTLKGATLADCSIGATMAASLSSVEDSVFVGQSDNGPASLPKPWESGAPRVGFEFYDGPVSVERCRFEHFEDTETRKAGALTVLRFSPFFVDPRNSIRAATFERARPVYLPRRNGFADEDLSGDGYRSAAFVDLDGSVAGSAGASIAVRNPFLQEDGCRAVPQWGAMVCDSRYVRLFLDARDRPAHAVGPVTVSSRGTRHVMGGVPETGPNRSFQTLALPNREYDVRFARQLPKKLRIAMRFAERGDWLTVVLPYPAAPKVVRDHRTPITLSQTRAEFEHAKGDAAFHQNGRLYVRLTAGSGRMPDGDVCEITR
jgi:cell migration-inducing and hyaluronan-binding protein